MNKKRIAIIGTGISGLSAAYFIDDHHQIKIYEKNNYIGGHSNTVDVDYNGKQIAVDTGFIVFNHLTYPNLRNFFSLLDVTYEKSVMSFGIKVDDADIEYAGTNLASIFAQKKNLFDVKFIKMLFDIIKFNKNATEILASEFNPNFLLKNLLDDLNLGEYFRNYYLLPMSAAIWSCPMEKMLNYPAQSFVKFFENHGLLTVNDQPQWFTVSSGSRQYVQKIVKKIGINLFSLNDEVYQVVRDGNKVLIKSKKGEEVFDEVVFACHGDQVLKIVANPSKQEKEIFANFKYQKNTAILHRDSSLMPKSKKAWASWIYQSNKNLKSDQVSVSYWMNNLQNIDAKYPLFVTLNPISEIKKDKIFAEFIYHHPIFDAAAISSQKKIEQIQGVDKLYFCGAYQRFGFHEDGISSAIKMINKMNIFTKWQN
jgi:predicted NAD/FAD-binding protein